MISSDACLQASRRFDEAGRLVAIVKFGVREKPKLGLVEDQDVNELEQFRPAGDRRRWVEDGGRTGRARPFEEGADRRQRNFELADGDVALGQHRSGDILGTDQRVGAGNDHDGVVGIGDGDDRRSGMDIRGVLDEREVDALRPRNVRNCWPNASVPSRPISAVDAPSFAAATAWLAPLPPGK